MISKSESIKNISAALLEFQNHMGIVIKEDVNPFFKNAYASLPTILSAIKGPLLASGLTFSQMPSGINELTTILMHPASGEWIESSYVMVPTKNDPQGLGSAISYQRRYALGAVLGLNIDTDDDANEASKPMIQSVSSRPVVGQIIASGTSLGQKEIPNPIAASKHFVCPVHGDTVQFRPAGVTKAGKPYSGFWACTERVGTGFCKAKLEEVKATPVVSFDDNDEPPFSNDRLEDFPA